MSTVTFISDSASQTEDVGRRMAEILPEGAVVALYGELAAGKTCFIRGMARHIAPDATPSSPTFTLFHEYGEGPRLYHVDLYRLESLAEIQDLGLEEIFENSGAVCAVEWADRARTLLPARRVDVTLEHAGNDRRSITIVNHELLAGGWQKGLQSPKHRPAKS